MTQEELDALMAGDFEDEEIGEETAEEIAPPAEESAKKTDPAPSEQIINYEGTEMRISSNMPWPPPPPTDDHKMVHQLDDVTKDSEEKATQMFDKLDAINNFSMDAESGLSEIIGGIEANIEIFTKLHEKFPNIAAFSDALEKNNALKSSAETTLDNVRMAEDEIMMAMDMMQYQDIHRQKIERVINVMRALSKYMSSLFEGKIDDEKRVASAVHIAGDTHTENLVSNDDIEALIESLGKK
ncbi:chemotaxis protein [Campylobacter showae]|uniref:chemotaxis protein n=1 Tax=Campylobacter showae TaxID=204 RepID=UPI0028D2AB80|nr:chemotaxis protein [Campylobacter showae]